MTRPRARLDACRQGPLHTRWRSVLRPWRGCYALLEGGRLRFWRSGRAAHAGERPLRVVRPRGVPEVVDAAALPHARSVAAHGALFGTAHGGGVAFDVVAFTLVCAQSMARVS